MNTTHTNGRVTITVVEHWRRPHFWSQSVLDKIVLVDVQPRELMQEGYDLFHEKYPPQPRVCVQEKCCVMRQTTEAEFDAYVAEWPRPLRRQVWIAHEPPIICMCDDTLGRWPDSVVASFYYDNYLDPTDLGWRVLQ